MMDDKKHFETLAPKYREIKEGEVFCPLYKDMVPTIECKKCRYFIRIQENMIVCAYTWE